MLKLIKFVYASDSTPPTPIPLGNFCADDGLGPFAKFLCGLEQTSGQETPNAVKTISAFALIISNVIGIMSVVAGMVFLFQILISGYNWLTSGGDKEKLSKAQQGIVNAVIGLTVVLAAYALISLVSQVLGFDILLNDPADFVELIQPK